MPRTIAEVHWKQTDIIERKKYIGAHLISVAQSFETKNTIVD